MLQMRVTSILLVGLCLLGASCVGVNKSGSLRAKVTGQWEVSIAGIPMPNQSFIIDIREVDNAIVFDILQDQSIGELDIKEMRLTEKDNRLSANLYIGEFVKLIIWEEEGVVKGEIQIPMIGDLPLILKRLKE